MKNTVLRALALALLLSGSCLRAEETVDLLEDSGPTERWYRIELLIFRQKADASAIGETWPHDITLTYPPLWARLKTPDEYVAQPQPPAALANWLARIKTSPFTPFVLQPESSKSFAKGAKQIQRFEGDVLFHQVWWQPFIQNDQQEAPAILIRGGKLFADHYELEGSVQFRLSRYLHMSTNLWLTEFAPLAAPPDNGELPPLPSWPELPLAPDRAPALAMGSSVAEPTVTATPLYETRNIALIRQSRRMRSEETHYLDHPRIGMLVRLTPQPTKAGN